MGRVVIAVAEGCMFALAIVGAASLIVMARNHDERQPPEPVLVPIDCKMTA